MDEHTAVGGATTPSVVLGGLGSNIAAYRRAAGLTQGDLAARIGRSVQWVTSVERGRRHADRLSDLVHIAQACRCGLEDLIGRPVDSTAPGVRPRSEMLASVRAVIMRSAVPTLTAGTAQTLDSVGARVEDAWRIWHGSPTAHSLLGEILPTLLSDATTAYRAADDRRAGARVLAGAYQITRQWLHHLPEGELAWIAADRAMSAAREADDPHLVALGAWALAASYRRAGQQDEATQLCLAAADELKAHISDIDPNPDLLADYGMLHLAAAISAAQSDEDGRAWALHRVAEEAVRSLGSRYHPWTAFGPGNVAIHGLAVHAELGRASDVVELSRRLHIDDVPSVERRARVLIDTARAFVQRGEDEAAILVLLQAEEVSSDEVRDSGLVHDLVREVLHRDRARARTQARSLARRIGLMAA